MLNTCNTFSAVFLVAALTGNVAIGQQVAGHDEQARQSTEGREPSLVAAMPVGSPRDLPPAFYGFNVNLLNSGTSWRNSQLLRAAQDLCPGNLRYPGGTLANYWNWRAGAPLQHPGAPKWSKGEPIPYRLEELKLAVDATGAQPILVVNMLTSTIEEQLAMLRRARDLGLAVRYVELGNEFYLSEESYIKRFPTAEDYGAEATRWIDLIRMEFPKARIAAVGAYETARQAERRASWNGRMLKTLRGADAVVLHVYVGSGLGTITRTTTQAKPTGSARRPNPWYGAPEIQQQQLQALKTPEGARVVLSMPFRAADRLQREMQQLPGLAVWVTEYNLFDRIGPTKGTWAHGLFTATMLGLFLEKPQIELTCCHVFGSPITSFATVFVTEDPFRESILRRRVALYTPTATGIALRAFGRAMQGMRSARKIAFEPESQLVSTPPPFRPLVGWSFTDGRRRRAILLNLSDRPVYLDPGTLKLRGCTYEQMSASPGDVIASVEELHPARGEATDHLALPSYSLTLMREASAREVTH